MSLHVNTFINPYLCTLLFLFANASFAEELPVEYRVTSITHKVRAHASLEAPKVGIIYPGDVFEVGPIVGYEDCAAGWAKVKGGVLCLVKTKVVETEPIDLPELLDILPPTTDTVLELEAPTAQEPAFMPVLFATRSPEHEGRLWGSVDEYLNGEEHRWRLDEGKDYRFVQVHQTEKGWLLERPNGAVTPMTDVRVYPISRYAGRDFTQFPLEEGALIAWVSNPHGTEVFWDPEASTPSGLLLERRRILEFHDIADNPDWLKIPMGDLIGFVKRSDVTVWTEVKAPDVVQEDTIWIDADISTQMLSVKVGSQILYATLMSTAREGHETPLGTYQIYDKSVGWDLGSREGDEDPYYMEKVPFVMHYYPRYAIHSAFWHDNFGEPASHGCINLAPKDALAVYQLVGPEMPSGWQYVKQTDENIGSILRIRNAESVGKSKRIRP